MKYLSVKIFLFFLFFLSFFSCDNFKTIKPYKNKNKAILEGSILFQNNCASCHGVDAQGDGNQALRLEDQPADLYLISEKNSVEELRDIILSGKGHSMPSFGEALSKNDILKIAIYLKNMD